MNAVNPLSFLAFKSMFLFELSRSQKVKHDYPFELCESAHEASAELKNDLVKRDQIVDPDLSKMVQNSITSVKQRCNNIKMPEKSKTCDD